MGLAVRVSEGVRLEEIALPGRHPLFWSLLRVRDGNGGVVGAAFFAAEGWVCTCAHVVAEALGVEKTSPEKPAGKVRLEFYRDGTPVFGTVECWVPAREQDDDPSLGVGDIALLRVCEPEPGEVLGGAARLLAPRHLSGHPFGACGFPGGEGNGVWAHGEFSEQRANGTFQIESPGPAGFRVQPGFSGAPVWDVRERGVVGMVVTSWRDPQARAAFVIPVRSLIAATAGLLRVAGSTGPFAGLTGGLSIKPKRALVGFLENYVGTPERPAPFGGRQAEMDALDSWLNDPGCPYRLMVAPAGQGKSTLLANWAKEVSESNRAEVILVPISLRFATNQLVDVEKIVRERLRELLADGGQGGGLDIAEALARERDPPDRPLLLVFDSIDEASAWRPEIALPLPPFPVPGIRVLVSARVLVDRDADGWLNVLGWREVADTMGVGALDRDGIRDVLTTLNVGATDGATADSLVDAVYDASDRGDPLLVGLFAAAIGPGGFVTADTLPSLTGGLNAYFDLWWNAQREHWDAERKDRAEESKRATLLFGTLAGALGPLTLDELSRLTDDTPAAVLQEHLTEFGRWVIAVGGDGPASLTYSFAHPRLGEYWRERKMTVQERNNTDRRLRQFCQEQLQALREGADPRSASPYALRYYTTHLENEHADYEQFDAMICPVWWHAHRAVTHSDETFLRDIWATWDRAEQLMDTLEDDDSERAGELIGRLFRYTLITTLLHSLSNNLPSELLVRLVSTDPKRWIPRWAIEQARRHADPYKTLADLAPHLPENERTPVLSEALKAAQAIGDAHLRVWALAELAPRLPEDQRTPVLSEALQAAQTISNENLRVQALMELAPQLPEQLLSEALKAAQAISDEDWRVWALVELVPRLPEDQRTSVLSEALKAAQAISNEDLRVWALMELAPRLPEDQRTPVLSKALKAAQAISEENLRVRALAALAPQLPEQLLSEALKAAQAISEEYLRVQALAALAPRLLEDQRTPVLSEALKAAQAISNEDLRVQALAALAPRLPEDQRTPVLSEALKAAQAISEENLRVEALAALAPQLPEQLLSEALKAAQAISEEYQRVQALAELAPRLPEDQRTLVLSEALKAAQAISDENLRVRALAALAPQLPEQLLSEALKAAQAISDENWRVRALAELAPRLLEDQRTLVLSEALKAAQAISEENLRVRALMELAPRLLEDQRTLVLSEALKAAQAISEEYLRVRALAALAPRLLEDQRTAVLSEALKAAQAISEEYLRVQALAALAPRLPEDQRTPVLSEALKAAQAISDEDWRAWALAALAPQLPEQLLSEALQAAQTISNENLRVRALAALAPQLPEQLLSEALKAAQAISEEYLRVRALMELAPRLLEDQRTPVLSEALKAAQAISDENLRVRALAALAPQLPEQLLSEALKAAQAISEEYLRVQALAALAPRLPEDQRTPVLSEALKAAQAISDENWRVWALVELAPRLPEDQRTPVLSEALKAAQAISDENWRVWALAELAPRLPEDQRTPVLSEALKAAQAIGDEYLRVQALVELAPQLPEQLLSEALKAAQAISDENLRVRVLAALAPQLSTAPASSRRRLARSLLRLIASGSRLSVLTNWRGLDQLITLEGTAACYVVASSIIEVTRWSSLAWD